LAFGGGIGLKFKFDRQYLKISAYAVVSLAAAYALFKLVDSAAFIITNSGKIAQGIGSAVGWIACVFSVVIMAFVVAYVLDPLVEYLQRKYEDFSEGFAGFRANPLKGRSFRLPKLVRSRKKGAGEPAKRRTAGAALTYGLFTLLLGALIAFTALRIRGADGFTASLVALVNSTLVKLSDFLTSARLTIEAWGASEYLSGFVEGAVDSVSQTLRGSTTDIIDKVTSVGGTLLNFFMSLVVAFYFLRDKGTIMERTRFYMDTFLSPAWNRRLTNAAGDLHAVFSGYIRGQLIDALIMGCLLSLALTVVGVDLAVLIGVFSGFANIIPYFGAIVGFVLSVGVALLSGDFAKAILAGVVVILLQQIDGVFIVPKVVGEKVELSPAHVLISLSVAGALFGLWGMVFAVPVCAILKIFIARLAERRAAASRKTP
jgi:predicted PurR-regulated permease PerM